MNNAKLLHMKCWFLKFLNSTVALKITNFSAPKKNLK